MSDAPLLQVRGLTVDLHRPHRAPRWRWPIARLGGADAPGARRAVAAGRGFRAVEGVDLDIGAGETVALVGPSGSGKTTIALAVLGLLPPGGRAAGQALWRGRDLLAADPETLRSVRGAEIGLVPQDPMAALHPLMRVDRQVAEAVLAHEPRLGTAAALARAAELLARTGLPPARRDHAGYPFEWSGGMRQRALIAMAIAHSPALLIADEPTTALDATTRAGILDLLRRIREETGLAMLLVTHDPDVVAGMADRVVSLRAGRVVGTGKPSAPADDEATGAVARPGPDRRPDGASGGPPASPAPLLRVEGLTVRYPVRGRRPGGDRWFTAVDDVSFHVSPGETLCLVGESGAGKSTLARAVVRLQESASGRVILDGEDLTGARGAALTRARRRLQIVFQDPYASLNPRRRVGATVVEPLRVHGLCRRAEAPDRAGQLLERVGLPAAYAGRFPFELSGGERQRVAIARAVALEPDLIVLDEPVTSLDADARAGIVRLLADLQERRGMAYLLIAHDLRFVRRIADRVAVMRNGRIVEIGPVAELFGRPRHPYTRELVAAV
jgi:peptide/nickel transport system ATP-binding protein